ncbi:MAG: hypothetical protein R3304_08420 [Longimicrobiales bacterium]|nr:hypothetical protein [Longimicrobiales bacterium]
MDSTLTIATATDGAAARAILTREEAEICTGLAHEALRSDYRAARLAERRAAEELGRDAVLSSAPRGGHAVAVASPAGARVGVALERSGSLHVAMVRSHLTRFEQRLAEGIDPTILWSVKQASWKALGLGPSLPVAELELAPDVDGKLVGIYIGDAVLPVHVRMSQPWPGFIMTAVWLHGAMA